VLDLFAGSGAMGIEALSRGAGSVTFVDADRQARAAIETNLTTCNMGAAATVLGSPAERYLADAARSGTSFDLAFVDPPYGFDGWDELLPALPAAVAVVESGRPLDVPPGWVELRAKRYGRTHVAILEREDGPEPP
jgi:16S rRNA (guanine966-N2)-methyltransferase